MKKLNLFCLAVLVGCVAVSCKKKTAPVPVQTVTVNNVYVPASSVSGQAVFYYNGGLAFPQITVSISGQVGQITTFYNSGIPACGTTGCATFSLTAGTYTWSAVDAVRNWTGSVTVIPNGCTAQVLQ